MIADPLVSVCIQAYQHEEWIAQCLESVLGQKTNFPFEIIVGEDDSSDGTRSICLAYQKKHPQLIAVQLGSSSAKMTINGRKTGRTNLLNIWSKARGQFVAMMDGDDYWCRTDKLQNQVNWLQTHPETTVVFTRSRVEDANGQLLYHAPEKDMADGHRWSRNDFLQKNLAGDLTSSAMFRASLLPDFFAAEWRKKVIAIDYPFWVYATGTGFADCLPELHLVRRYSKGSFAALDNADRYLFMLDLQYDIQRELGLSPEECKTLLAHRKQLLQTFAARVANEKLPLWYKKMYRLKRKMVD